MPVLSEYDKKWCLKIYNDLLKWPITAPFRFPVDPVRDNAPDYDRVVAKPMCLQTMKQKLSDGSYRTAAEFVDDFFLICDNAIRYNGEYSWAAVITIEMKSWMNEQFKKKAASSEDEWHRRLANIIEDLHEHVRNAPGSVAAVGPALVPQIEGISLG
jgi:hypothetical protein